MPKFRWMIVGAMLAAGALAFAACGGGDDSDGDDDGGEDRTPAATTTAGGSEPEPTSDDGNGGGGGGGDTDELLELAEKFVEATFTASYDVTSTGADVGLGDATMRIFKDGPDRMRFDISAESEGQPFEGSFIQNGETTYLCFTGDIVATLGIEGEGVCTESTANDPTNPVGSLTEDFAISEEDLADTTIERREEREIAGEDATCFITTSPDVTGETTVCMNDDGVLLLVDSEGSSFEATEVGDDPSSGDFEPPYEVQDLPF